MPMLMVIRLPHATFNAAVESRIVMGSEDLRESGPDKLGARWCWSRRRPS